MIRKATPADIPALVDLSIEALSIDPYPQLVIDRNRVYQCVTESVMNAQNFAWVSETADGIQGGLGALVMPLMCYERKQAQITMLYCKATGDGAKLLRQFRTWLKDRITIKQIIYSPERGADPRIMQLVTKMLPGSHETLPMLVVTR